VDFSRIQNLVASVLPKDRTPHQLSLTQVVKGLQESGFDIPERTVRRQMKGLTVGKGPGGFYAPADAALVLGWNMRRGQYSSYSEYFQLEGKKVYEMAQSQFS
jgi:hypothetical protein